MQRIIFSCLVMVFLVGPALAGNEYFVSQQHPDASDSNPGTAQKPFLTISPAAKIATAGDTVTIDSGVYRESVLLHHGGEPNLPLIFQAAIGAEVLIKGSDIIPENAWKRISTYFIANTTDEIWHCGVPGLKGRAGLFVFRREQVFVDGKLLRHVATIDDLTAGTFTIHDPSEKLFVCLSKGEKIGDHTIEISTRDCLFKSVEPTGYVVMRRLRFSQGANDPEAPGVSLDRCHHWLLEDIEATWMNGAGIRVGGSKDCTLRRVQAHFNGCTGISGGDILRLRLEDCRTNYNNQKNYPMGWESGGVKLLTIKDSVITGHQTCNNKGFGIWLDWACSRNRISRSVAIGNEAAGFNIEASRGPNWIDNCIAAFNGTGDAASSFWGDGIYSHDCDNLRLMHNLCYGNVSCGIRVRFLGGRINHEDGREVSCRGNRVANNLLLANGLAGLSYPADGVSTSNNHSNGNFFSPDKAAVIEQNLGTAKRWEEIERILAPQDDRQVQSIPAAGPQPAGIRLTSVSQWQKLTGNDSDSNQGQFSLLDPEHGDFRSSQEQTLPNAVPLKTILTDLDNDAIGPLPWPVVQIHPVGPFMQSFDQKAATDERWPSTRPADCPFENSKEMTGIAFTGRHGEYTGADTWYPTWAEDGNMYSGYTDGDVEGLKAQSWIGGEEGTTGMAKIIGDDPLNLTVKTLGLHFDNPSPYGGRYPCAYLCYEGIWYFGTYCLDDIGGECGNWCVQGPFVGFRTSGDYGKTWDKTPRTPQDNLFGESAKNGGKVKMGAPHFVDFGKNMQHSPDGKAYLIGHGASDADADHTWISGDEVYMARVTPSVENINDISKYDFFAGYNYLRKPKWSRDFSDIKPVIDWKDNAGCVTVTCNAPLKKYLMCVTHGYPTIQKFDTYILESNEVAGPYRLVIYMKDFGPQAYFVNIPSKFISADGRTAWLCYSANYVNDIDDEKFPKFVPNPPGSKYAMCLQEFVLLSD